MDFIKQAAYLRSVRNFTGAMKIARENYMSFKDGTEVVLLLQGLYAADEAQDESAAREFAKILVEAEPELPSIQKYL